MLIEKQIEKSKDVNRNRMIDLRSDTVTKPDQAMRLAMLSASVGDDCYNEDPSVHALQKEVAFICNKEEGLFMPSGTMSNQVALRSLTNPGDEVITHQMYHINYFESSQTADLARVTLNTCDNEEGFLKVTDIENAINKKPRGVYYAKPNLLWLENPVTATAGRVYPINMLKDISSFCRENKIHLHLDGARIFNAVAATGVSISEYSELVDSLTICFSKGLGAPFGSALIGSADFIEKSKKFRKWYGGGLHQIGFMASAALYGLKMNKNNFIKDYNNAKKLESIIEKVPGIKLFPVETNTVAIDLRETGIVAGHLCDLCREKGVLIFPWSKNIARGMMNCNVSSDEVISAGIIIKEVLEALTRKNFCLIS